MNSGWGWWAIQLLVPGIIVLGLLAMEIGWWIGYFPITR